MATDTNDEVVDAKTGPTETTDGVVAAEPRATETTGEVVTTEPGPTETTGEVVTIEPRLTDKNDEVVETKTRPTSDEISETDTRPTDTSAEAEQTERRPDLLWDAEARGLCLRVCGDGSKSFIFVYRVRRPSALSQNRQRLQCGRSRQPEIGRKNWAPSSTRAATQRGTIANVLSLGLSKTSSDTSARS